MPTNVEIGSVVLYKGQANAKVLYKAEPSYAELLAVKNRKATLNLLLLNVIVDVPIETVRLTALATRKKKELVDLMQFFFKASEQVLGCFPPIWLQKKCLSALIQSFELTENRLTKYQAIHIIMRVIRFQR